MDADKGQPVGALLDGQAQCGMADRLPGGLAVACPEVHGVVVHGSILSILRGTHYMRDTQVVGRVRWSTWHSRLESANRMVCAGAARSVGGLAARRRTVRRGRRPGEPPTKSRSRNDFENDR